MANGLTKIWNRLTRSKDQPLGTRRPWYHAGGVSVTEDSAMKVSAFYRGVTYIATQLAKIPWDVKDRNNAILDTDNIHYLLSLAPNPEMNAFTFRVLAISTAIIRGNFYAEIQRDTIGRVVALWPLDTSNVTPTRDAAGNLFYKITGANTDGEPVYLAPSQIFHLKNLHLSRDGITGHSVATYASTALGIVLAADEMASALFANGGIPSGVLRAKGLMDDGAYERLKASWKDAEKGAVRILEEDVTYEPIEVDPQVLQFLESRKFGVVEIARFLGLPPTKLFDMSASTFNNVENANLEVETDTLASWAANLEMEADVKLLARQFAGRFTELDLSEMSRGDMNTRSTYYVKMMTAASITPNEIRKREGMTPFEGGDSFFLATNNFTPMDRVNDVIDAEIASKLAKVEAVKDAAKAKEEEPEADPVERQLKVAALKFLNQK